MKKVYIGVFAHPDDESFGPSGSLYTYIQNGADVFLICATTGQNGTNTDNHDDLGAVRYTEWLAAGKVLGAKEQFCLHYHDGELSNNMFHTIAAATQQYIEQIAEKYPEDTEFILLTFEPYGISGHIDHIVMSNVTSYIFEELRCKDTRFSDVHYYCIHIEDAPVATTDFVYMPHGKRPSEITITNDITSVFEIKKKIMRAHASQQADAESIIARFERHPIKQEYFFTYKDR
jgi:LmbE family N-acetylglucosaminyl deacetylase